MSLPPDATIATISHLLAKPADYIPAVFGRLNADHRAHAPATVRIGLTGEGKFPNYRIEHANGLTGPFSGQTHDSLANAENAQEETWSQLSMTFD